MKYAGLMKNDLADGEGVCVSFWTQGCSHHCAGCHNPETWDPQGGTDLPSDILFQIDQALNENNINRNFSILGGEPFFESNIELTNQIVSHVCSKYPSKKIFCWTGYTLEELKEKNDAAINDTLSKITVLIDGPFIQEQRDTTLHLRGSANQRILYRGRDF